MRYCRARCAVLGVLLVGCKIFPSGISLERPTRQNTTEPTTKLVSILQRLFALPLEILVERAPPRKTAENGDGAGGAQLVSWCASQRVRSWSWCASELVRSWSWRTRQLIRAESVLQPSSKPAAAGAGRGSREPRSHELKLRFGAHQTARAQKSLVRWTELRACCKRPRSRPVAEPTGAAKNPPHPS